MKGTRHPTVIFNFSVFFLLKPHSHMSVIFSPDDLTQSDIHLSLRSLCGDGREAWSTGGGTRTPFLRFKHQSRWPGAFESAAPFQSAGVSGHPWKKVTHYPFWSLKSPPISHVYLFSLAQPCRSGCFPQLYQSEIWPH